MGHKCFRNELIWHYFKPHASKAKWARNFDILLHYGKSSQDAKTQADPMLKTKFNHEATLFEYDEKSVKRYDKVDEEGKRYKIYTDKRGVVRKAYMKDGVSEGVLKIPFLQGTSKERTGYATQKPLALLKRIIQASTNEGDVVLDPFCGCGTAVVAAHDLKREFVGIDISLFAVETVTYDRLKDIGITPIIQGIPEDFASAKRLAKEDPFAFESFAVEACHPGMVGNKVQRKDGGVDGTGKLLFPVKNGKETKSIVLAQVKAGKPKVNDIRAFANSIQDTKGAVAGVSITLEKSWWTEEMRAIAHRQGTFQHPQSATQYPRLQHWHIKQNGDKLNDDEAMWAGFPILPELSNPLSGKELTIKQPTFWKRR